MEVTGTEPGLSEPGPYFSHHVSAQQSCSGHDPAVRSWSTGFTEWRKQSLGRKKLSLGIMEALVWRYWDSHGKEISETDWGVFLCITCFIYALASISGGWNGIEVVPILGVMAVRSSDQSWEGLALGSALDQVGMKGESKQPQCPHPTEKPHNDPSKWMQWSHAHTNSVHNSTIWWLGPSDCISMAPYYPGDNFPCSAWAAVLHTLFSHKINGSSSSAE